MKSSVEILVDQIISAFQRLRAVLFVSSIFCALLFANAYMEQFSYDQKQIFLLNSFKTDLESKKKNAESKVDAIKISEYTARLKRIDNTLNDFKFRVVTIPIIGLIIPANDLNVITGIFLVALAVWSSFSISQIMNALTDPVFEDELKVYFPVLKHCAVFLNPPSSNFVLTLTANMLLALPPVTIGLATIMDIWTTYTYDIPTLLVPMREVLIARAIVLFMIVLVLSSVSYQLIKSRNFLVQLLYPSAKNTARSGS